MVLLVLEMKLSGFLEHHLVLEFKEIIDCSKYQTNIGYHNR
jgi:hypothetical protein